MVQLHCRFTDEQVAVLFRACCKGVMTRAAVQEELDIGKTRFFALLKEYRSDPGSFSIAYQRPTPGRLSSADETEIERELQREKEIVEDKRLPISARSSPPTRPRSQHPLDSRPAAC